MLTVWSLGNPTERSEGSERRRGRGAEVRGEGGAARNCWLKTRVFASETRGEVGVAPCCRSDEAGHGTARPSTVGVTERNHNGLGVTLEAGLDFQTVKRPGGAGNVG